MSEAGTGDDLRGDNIEERISTPNEHGVLSRSFREIVAKRGRAFAAVNIARCEDGRYRFGVEMQYSHGGLSFPIRFDDSGYATIDAARVAGIAQLLKSWHRPYPSDSHGVRLELTELRAQLEARLRQPTLF